MAVSKAPVSPAWHAASTSEAMALLDARPEGLASADAARRLEITGRNVLPRKRSDGALKLLVRQIHNPLIYVLLGSAVIALAMGKMVDGLVVLGVVVVNTIIGFAQEYRAGKAIDALVSMVPDTAVALRDGARASINAAELVPGDVVLLQSGDKVPADLRLIGVKNLHIDEAPLTGESVPVAKRMDECAADASIGDRKNLAFGGTLVTSGVGTGLVVATAGATELGRISAMLAEATEIETPLTRSMARVSRGLTIVIVGIAVLMVGVGVLRGYSMFDALLAGISLAVAAIPEGLPAIVTIALAIGVQRMARRRAVIRKLPAVETLGSTAVICSDKTGTLTRNEMTVRALWTPAGARADSAGARPVSRPPGSYDVTGVGYAPVGELQQGAAQVSELPEPVRELVRAGALCNDASLVREGATYSIGGDPTEGALVVAAEKLGLGVEGARRDYPRMDAIPFESERQFMATLHRAPDASEIVLLKGAPEVVLERCDRQAGGASLDAAAAIAAVEEMAQRGMRVLAVASRPRAAVPGELVEADVERGFTLLGLEGMIDPPRPEAIEAVRDCKAAGITVKMITGDHKSTACAVAEQLGILSPGGLAVGGAELSTLSDTELRDIAQRCNVFARVAPEHKLRLVKALQADGLVVAMTGDGVNDAPALKQADIGVAMGITGTAVSKESADVVLTDDNFATIRAAVEEGRRVYDNLVKALAFVLPTNLGEGLILLVAVMFFPITAAGPLMPITPVQILWVNLVATVTLSLPLALEAMERDVMSRPPRRPDEPVLGPFVLWRTIMVAALMAAGAIGLFLYEYFVEVAVGIPGEIAYREAQTMAVTTVVLFQVFYVLNCRSLQRSMRTVGLFTNPYVYGGIAAVLALQVGFVHLPFMNGVFGSAPLPWDAWLQCLLVASTVVPVIAFEKWWRNRRQTRASGPGPAGVPTTRVAPSPS